MDGFDPENDFTDRRIYFEVTGQSLIPFEFLHDDSSAGEERNEILDPLVRNWATKEDEKDEQLLPTRTIN